MSDELLHVPDFHAANRFSNEHETPEEAGFCEACLAVAAEQAAAAAMEGAGIEAGVPISIDELLVRIVDATRLAFIYGLGTGKALGDMTALVPNDASGCVAREDK